MLRVGELLGGDFEIRKPLSQGGMGAVFLAHQLSTDTPRAIKVMLPEWLERAELRERFEREAKASGRIQSEHVVKIVAFGIDADRQLPWMAMEYLEGQTLEDRVDERGTLPRGEIIELLRQLFHGVSAAHRAQVVHRDLKPPNVFVANSQRADVPFTVKVLDFGIAKVLSTTRPGTLAMGTHAWMAPEQEQQGAVITPTADVWALGLIVFWLLTGRCFWLHAETSAPLLSIEVHFEPIPPASERSRALGAAELGPDFDAWFRRCVAREPGQRFADAGRCWAALEPVLGALPAASHSGAPSPHASAPVLGAGLRAATTTTPQALGLRSFPAPNAAARSGVPWLWLVLAVGLPIGLLGVVALGLFTYHSYGHLLKGNLSGGSTPNADAPTEASAPNASVTTSPTSSRPESAIPSSRLTPPGMVWVGPGTFSMGAGLDPPMGPERNVTLTHGFFLDKLEVSVTDYQGCVDRGRCSESRPHGPGIRPEDERRWLPQCNAGHPERADHPINCIDHGQARAYCQFRGKRLPTEAEWEYAARGSDGRTYPWGNTLPESCDLAVVSGLCPATGTRPVGTRSPSSATPLGAMDMAGNVWEWVADSYDPRAYETAARIDPVVTTEAQKGVLRGGSWDFARSHAKTTHRLPFDRRMGHVSTGVRCVMDGDPPTD